MRFSARTMVVATLVLSCIVFAVVQDRVTVAAAKRYAALQRQAIATGAPPVRIDDVMRPAVAQSVCQGLLWAGVVLLVGLGVVASTARRPKPR